MSSKSRIMDPIGQVDSRPEPKDLSHHISRTTRAREASSIKQFYKYFQIPGIGQLAGGLPNNYYFPFDTLEAKVARPDRWHPTPNHPVDPPPKIEEALAKLSLHNEGSPLNQPQDSITVPHTSAQPNPMRKIDLSTALQYGQAVGYPPLFEFIRTFTRDHMHPNCPYKDGPDVVLTCGNTDGFNKILTAMVNDWSEEKDWIRDKEGLLCEEFAYMNALQAAKPRGMNIVPVAIDDEGMLARGKGGLQDVLEQWDHTKGKRPHLMYTVTMGQNPTSGVLSLQRRREIYELCSKYDIIIVEDDPYWYLQFPSATKTSFNQSRDIEMFANAEPKPANWKSGGYKFLDSLVPSYVQIDVEGRVLRLDTFSKTVAPGCRLGWITGQPKLIERLLRVTETSTQQPSGFVQSIIAELILGPDHASQTHAKSGKNSKDGKGSLPSGEGWKADGWVRWLEGLRGNYERRMNEMSTILDANKYQVKSGRRGSLVTEDEDEWSVIEKTELYSFDWPVGGMFIWLQVHFESHPLYNTYAKAGKQAQLSHALWIFWTTKPYLVLGAPGQMFAPTDKIRDEQGWKYFRLCFAAIDDKELGPTAKRLADGVAAFWRIKDTKTIDKLLQEDGEAVQSGAGSAQLAQMIGPC